MSSFDKSTIHRRYILKADPYEALWNYVSPGAKRGSENDIPIYTARIRHVDNIQSSAQYPNGVYRGMYHITNPIAHHRTAGYAPFHAYPYPSGGVITEYVNARHVHEHPATHIHRPGFHTERFTSAP